MCHSFWFDTGISRVLEHEYRNKMSSTALQKVFKKVPGENGSFVYSILTTGLSEACLSALLIFGLLEDEAKVSIHIKLIPNTDVIFVPWHRCYKQIGPSGKGWCILHLFLAINGYMFNWIFYPVLGERISILISSPRQCFEPCQDRHWSWGGLSCPSSF